MNGTEATAALLARGYTFAQADKAIREAAGSGECYLRRHAVVLLADGSYQISPRPWADDPGAQVLSPVPPSVPRPAPGSITLNEALEIIEVVDQHLDDAGPQWAKDCPEANMARRVGKAQLEAAEAMEELSLLTGENPRKGRHPEARERMLAELGDTAVAALLGIQSQVKNTELTWAVFLGALGKARSRVPGGSPLPPESGMTRQDAAGNGITG